MLKRLRLKYIRLLMIDDASKNANFDDFAKRDGRTDGRMERHTGLWGCNGRIQKAAFRCVLVSLYEGLSVRPSVCLETEFKQAMLLACS